ncbi:MAG: hypothetical protein QW728_00840 [Thermoplasmata archaeon]
MEDEIDNMIDKIIEVVLTEGPYSNSYTKLIKKRDKGPDKGCDKGTLPERIRKRLEDNPIVFLKNWVPSYSSGSSMKLRHLADSMNMDEDTFVKTIREWAKKWKRELRKWIDVREDPEVVDKLDFLTTIDTVFITNPFEFGKPLHARSIPRVSDTEEFKKKFGEFRISTYTFEKEFGKSWIYEKKKCQVLEKKVNDEWKNVLEIEVESWEREPFEPKESIGSAPPFYPRIYTDMDYKSLYIEQEDGTLYYSSSGEKWDTVSFYMRNRLYTKYLYELKWIEIPKT